MLKRKRSESDLIDIAGQTTSQNKGNHCDNSYCNTPQCWLLQLPLDVLEHIFRFLCPRSLIAITSLNIERFDIAASELKSYDFSVCNDVHRSEISSLLTSNRVNHIKAINFNYVFLVRSYDLMQLIVRCKHLTSLSVIDCGIKFKYLCLILDECKELQELSWTVLPSEQNFHFPLRETSPYGLKKLHLHLCNKQDILKPALYIINRSLSAGEIFLNFSPSQFPLRCRRNTVIYRLHMDLKCPVKIIIDDWNEDVSMASEYFREGVKCCSSNDEWFMPLTMTSPFLQLVTRPDDFSHLSSLANESVPTLILYCATNNLSTDELAPVKRVTGKALTHLCLKKMPFQTLPEIISGLNNSCTMHCVVPHVIADCHYIKDLKLSDLHFDCTFDFEVLYSLKGLTTLFIPACLLKADPSEENCNLENNFENFVKRSKQIQHFSIKGCFICSIGPKDKDIAIISEWSELRTLSLLKLRNLQFCHFLRDVADKCVHLKGVELVMIGSAIINHYIPSVNYMLEKSPQLMFLSTSLGYCCSGSKRFWTSIGLAKNLQGLCLTESTTMQTYCKPIVDAIEKLKYLHLFHLSSNNKFENLEKRVRRAMKRNGVKCPKIYIGENCLNYTECDIPHIFIP